MDVLISIILGIVQGLTEFLPISSSGHLVIFHDILNWQTADNLAFDVFLHWGTLVALVIYFYKDIIRYLRAFLKSLRHWNLKNDLDQKLAWLILISMVPAVIAGLFLNKIIDQLFRNIISVAFFLIIVGLIFLLVEKYCCHEKELTSLTWGKSLLLGVAQAIALIPGVSRSGATISTGLAFNLKREEAARFSFLMSIPIVFAAGMKKAWDMKDIALSGYDILIYLAGFVAAVIAGYLVIKFLLNYLKNHSLNIFAYYRIIVGVAIIIYFMVI
ncbi:MAG: undecaprenyl-diphosphatase UppP [Candidatus Parcubacteria bacterium]|nr:undecaprenyl-diphosphatase UppP [Candidatus Parcubacteria bacterium]